MIVPNISVIEIDYHAQQFSFMVTCIACGYLHTQIDFYVNLCNKCMSTAFVCLSHYEGRLIYWTNYCSQIFGIRELHIRVWDEVLGHFLTHLFNSSFFFSIQQLLWTPTIQIAVSIVTVLASPLTKSMSNWVAQRASLCIHKVGTQNPPTNFIFLLGNMQNKNTLHVFHGVICYSRTHFKVWDSLLNLCGFMAFTRKMYSEGVSEWWWHYLHQYLLKRWQCLLVLVGYDWMHFLYYVVCSWWWSSCGVGRKVST